MTQSKRTEDNITLGSGDLYLKEFSEDEIASIEADPSNICVEENFFGAIKGGASIKYGQEFYKAEDDKGRFQKTIITSETATLSTGVITWNGDSLTKLTSTGRVTDDGTESGYRVVKIGGVDNFVNKSYLVCFHHEDAKDGDCWVIIRGQNQSELEISFTKDDETSLPCEFTCLSQDDTGTLVTFIEETGTE